VTAAVQMSGARGAPRTSALTRDPWIRERIGDCDVWYAGDVAVARELSVLPAGEGLAARATKILGSRNLPFAVIADRPDGILAATDHCRSYPVFFTQRPDAAIGSDAQSLRESEGLNAFDDDAVREVAMSGFVTGASTICAGLRQLEPGAIAHWPAGTSTDTPVNGPHRWFVYTPDNTRSTPDADLSGRLDAVMDAATDRVMISAQGAPVWVPLSGGLDSRLVLAKLKARGYDNLRAFSYGPRGNADAVVAQAIAEKLDVPWQFVPTPPREVRDFFSGDVRRRYWEFSDRLAATPNNQDLLPLIKLRDNGDLPDDAVIVNGQTGDFISGGHVPARLFETPTSTGALVAAIIQRHYDLWHSLRTPENLAMAETHIRKTLGLPPGDDSMLEPEQAIGLWERFEYEGRQARYIINGQRSYEFLSLRWALPLWDGEMVRFWRDVPIAQKRDQHLYRQTWRDWNYRNVFTLPTRKVTAWSRPVSAGLIPLSIATRLVAGRRRRDRWMTYARYFDRFGNHYQAFGWKHFRRHAADARNPAAFYTRAWLDERGVPWPGGATQP